MGLLIAGFILFMIFVGFPIALIGGIYGAYEKHKREKEEALIRKKLIEKFG